MDYSFRFRSDYMQLEVKDDGSIYSKNLKLDFKLQEFVDQSTWNARGAKSFEQISPMIILGMQFIRDMLPSSHYIIVNTWYVGGTFSQRGRRMSSGQGASYSQHLMGKAVDFNVVDGATGRYWTSKEVFNWVLSHKDVLFAFGFTNIEHWADTKGSTGVGWTHLDMRPSTMDSIRVFRG